MQTTKHSPIRPFNVPAAWEGQTLHDDQSWIIRLTDGHRTELLAALEHFKNAVHARGLTAQWLHGHMVPAPGDFPLPTLGPLLQQGRVELEERYGLVLFKGFPVTKLSLKDMHLLHAGLAGHVGTVRPQTVFGELVQDIKDGGQDVEGAARQQAQPGAAVP